MFCMLCIFLKVLCVKFRKKEKRFQSCVSAFLKTVLSVSVSPMFRMQHKAMKYDITKWILEITFDMYKFKMHYGTVLY